MLRDPSVSLPLSIIGPRLLRAQPPSMTARCRKVLWLRPRKALSSWATTYYDGTTWPIEKVPHDDAVTFPFPKYQRPPLYYVTQSRDLLLAIGTHMLFWLEGALFDDHRLITILSEMSGVLNHVNGVGQNCDKTKTHIKYTRAQNVTKQQQQRKTTTAKQSISSVQV